MCTPAEGQKVQCPAESIVSGRRTFLCHKVFKRKRGLIPMVDYTTEHLPTHTGAVVCLPPPKGASFYVKKSGGKSGLPEIIERMEFRIHHIA